MVRVISLVLLPLAALELFEYHRGQDQLAVVKSNSAVFVVIEAAMVTLIIAASLRPSSAFIYFQF